MCLRWTTTEQFGGPVAMACPSAQIARTFHHTRRKIRQVLAESEPPPYTRTHERPAPVLGPFRTIIDQILADDEHAPPKQRHTAAQVFRRLRDEHGYPGGYAQVQRYLRKHRRRHQETFIPLGHLPGQRLEADFGHIHVDFPDGRRLVPFLVTTWAYSNAPFVLALPFERTEAILEGMVAAFEFFGSRPQGSLVGQPQNGRDADPPGTRAPVPSALRRAGQPLRSSTRASACRPGATRSPTPRAPSRPCNAVRHARAPRRRSR